jgi:hypothetical protein
MASRIVDRPQITTDGLASYVTTQSVALANMKISDTVALRDAPKVTAALSDYAHTEPTLRAILSNAGSTVIAANDDVSAYRLAAA